MRSIVTVETNSEILRKPSKKVKNPQAPAVLMLVQDMKRIAHEWESQTGRRAEGLAAPQIGVNLQVCIIRKSDDMMPRNPDSIPNNTDVYKTEQEYLDALKIYREWVKAFGSTYDPWHVLINPVFISSEGSQEFKGEGCLSVPGKHAHTVRPEKVVFKYTTLTGKPSGKQVAKGFSAVVVTHEIDHLKGHLFIDNAIDIRSDDKPYPTEVTLGPEDSAAIAEMVENPPEPTEALVSLLDGEGIGEFDGSVDRNTLELLTQEETDVA